LLPREPAQGRAQQLRLQLQARVQASVRAHRDYQTVRRDDGAWLPVAPGVTQRVLRSTQGMRVALVRLDAGACLPWPADADAQEVLLLQGALAGPDGQASPAGVPGAAAYCVQGGVQGVRGPGAPLRATVSSLVYVRQKLAGATDLDPLEAHWWRLASALPAWVDPGRRRWYPSSAGVDALPLRGNSDVVSMLVRFAPGASVPDHAHALDEDCLVLQGEMFLGDILLRTGDYQLAPAGGSHFGETSDVGVLFFFHGALDPVLRGTPAR
jgi:quercetin dioxygenase-like cupin family protein